MSLSTVETVVGHWVTLVKAHEKLLLYVIVALTALHLGSKGLDIYDAHLKSNQLKTNADIAALEQKIADGDKALSSLKATVDANAAIDDAKIAAAKNRLTVVQKTDAALPLPELSTRWQSMLSLPDGSINPQPNGTVSVTTDAAHTTVNELEKVGPLTDQLIATQDELKGCNSVVSAQTTQITNLNSDIALEKKGRADDAKVASADRKKAWRNGFKWGVITGFIGGLFVGGKL